MNKGSIYPSIYLSIYVSIYPSIYLSIYIRLEGVECVDQDLGMGVRDRGFRVQGMISWVSYCLGLQRSEVGTYLIRRLGFGFGVEGSRIGV